MRRLVTFALVFGLAGCAASRTDGDAGASPAPESVTLATGGSALVWGEGGYGLVLVHGAAYDAASWAEQARVLAETGMTVLAIERAEAGSLLAAIEFLRGERGVERVAVLGASAGAAAAMVVGREQPHLVDQLIVLSGSGDVSGLGVFPKLFAASEGEAAAEAAEAMTAAAPGEWNVVFLAPGEAHGQAIFDSQGGDALLDAIQRRLDERR